ncbi:MAG: rSAM/selenodomain-associated transferase 2, partial [Myxococcota bacterium]
QTALDSAPWAVAVGADSPGAPQRLYDAARDALETGAEAVIGPALDGGFYLLGLRRCPEGLFSDLSWSKATTCAEMIERLVAFGMAPVVIDPWYDVDEVEDLARLQRHLALGIVAAPETATVLASEPAPETAGVSVVVPVYNESARIAQTLADLAAVPGIAEVVIVDGQSTDATVNIVRVAAKGLACPVRVVIGRQGRARQQNGGAALAQHETLLFLHADVRLPTDAIAQVDATLGDPSVVAGAFKTWTVPDADAPRSLLAPFWHVADVRSRVTQFPYGDQAIFTRRATFDAVGGFPDLVLMEDLAFSQRLALLGTIALVDARVTVSARRMTHNWPLHMLMWNTFPTLFRLGVAPETLARWYRHVR